MLKVAAFSLVLVGLVLGGGISHGGVIVDDEECPRFTLANWANPGNYLPSKFSCHSYRVCDLNCDSTEMCCPVIERNVEGQIVRQMKWDTEACECVEDDGKEPCEGSFCEGAPAIPYFDEPEGTLAPGQCWRNGILYQSAEDEASVIDADGRSNSYIILQPSEDPFDPEVVNRCPDYFDNEVLIWRQFFDVDDCCCIGNTSVPEPEVPRCVVLDSADDLSSQSPFTNSGNKPRSLALTHRGVQIRSTGYFFTGNEGTCIEFPYFKSQAFWWPGFHIFLEGVRGEGTLISNSESNEILGTIDIRAAVNEEGNTEFTIKFDTLEGGVQTLVVPGSITSAETNWNVDVYFCHTFSKLSVVVTNGESTESFHGYVNGDYINLRDCPLAIGCDETSTDNFSGTIHSIEIACATCSLA